MMLKDWLNIKENKYRLEVSNIMDYLKPADKKIAIHMNDKKIYAIVTKNNLDIEYLKEFSFDFPTFKNFIKENKLKNTPAYLALGGDKIITRIIKIPKVPKNEIKNILRFEISKYIPLSSKELVYDYEILDNLNMDDDYIYLLIVVTKKKLVEEVCDLIYKAHLIPKKVEIEGAVLNNLHLNLINKEKNSCCMLLYNDRGVFSFICNNKVIYIHNFIIKKEGSDLFSEYEKVSSYLLRKYEIKNTRIDIFSFLKDEKYLEDFKERLGENIKNAQLSSKIYKLPAGIKSLKKEYYIPLGLLLEGDIS